MAIRSPHPSFLAQDIDPQIRTHAYRTWLREGVGDDELENIRAHLQQERALGDTTFQAMVQKALGRPVKLRNRGRPEARIVNWTGLNSLRPLLGRDFN